MTATPRFLRNGFCRSDAELAAEAFELLAERYDQPIADTVQTAERRDKARRARFLREHLTIKLGQAVASLALVLALAACGGTVVQYSGPLCGSEAPATLSVQDRKDRSAFDAMCRQTHYAPDGTVLRVDEVTISSSESSASAVIQAQSNAISQLAGAVAAGAARP